ncbi:MAG: hypothetical protein P1U86_03895 [Verrucomicrobiales bacterium]|nr:hypothetical protein [Verrucomicrobiales bacterium]
MNDSSFTILIPALLILSAALIGMLYARFVFRSRENSEEIDLVDIDMAMSSVSVAEPVEDRSEADDTQRVPFLDARPAMAPVLEVASAEEKVSEVSDDDEAEYFNELQEAAAGLAALMRSSPVGKSSPVVYAPDDLEEDVVAEVIRDESVREDEPREILIPVSELVSTDSNEVEQVAGTESIEGEEVSGEGSSLPDAVAAVSLEETEEILAEVDVITPQAEAVVENEESVPALIGDLSAESTEATEALSAAEDEAVAAGDAEIGDSSVPVTTEVADGIESNAPEAEAPTLRLLLGDEVADQFDTLDEGLNELENLVISIESALSSLNEELEEVISDDESEVVSEAA